MKCLKPIQYYKKLCSALLSKHKGPFLAPEAGKNSKTDKILKKFEKKAKIRIILCVCICSTKTYSS